MAEAHQHRAQIGILGIEQIEQALRLFFHRRDHGGGKQRLLDLK
jgi:hypothetical protein